MKMTFYTLLFVPVAAFRKCIIWIEKKYQTQRILSKSSRCGEGLKVNGQGFISGLGQSEFGDNVHIGAGYMIRGEGGLRVGSNTHFARRVTIYTQSHEYEGGCLPYDNNLRLRTVEIGKNVWIGVNVTILPGTRIGEGAIIGAGTVVFGEVPALSIMGSAPANHFSDRNREHYEHLENAKAYGGVNGKPITRN